MSGNTNPVALHLNGKTAVSCQGCGRFFGYDVKGKQHTVLECLQEIYRSMRERDY